MESGQNIESKTHPINSTGEVGLSISSKKLGSSLSSASDSSSDSSFELVLNEPIEFPGGTSDPLKKNESRAGGHSESEFEFISSDDISSAAKKSSRSLSRSSSFASESSMHDHVIELPKPEKHKDSKAMEPDLNKPLPKSLQTSSSSSSSSSSESKSERKSKIKLHQGGDASKNPSSSSMNKDNRLVEDFSDDDVPMSSTPGNGQSPATPTHRIDMSVGSEATTQYPPTQVMERADDPNSPAYRIPSHVFSRTKSTAPMEWSVASNESLFSIHMGNMSFTREQLCWLGKSGELYRPGETAMSPLIDLPSHRPLTIKPSDGGLKGTHSNGDLAATEARAAETMREVIRENSENHRMENAALTESSSQSASVSHQSEGSTKSFQFPILTGDGGKSISFKGGDPEKAKQETKQESSPQAAATSPETPKESSASESPKAAANAGPKRWFSCFSCCPFCS